MAQTNVQVFSGNVGIGMTGPPSKLNVASTLDPASATDSAAFDKYSVVITNTIAGDADDTEMGMAFANFGSTNFPNNVQTPGAAITHERVGGWSKGKLNFKTKGNTDFNGACTTRMTIDESGRVGIGTTNPGQKLSIYTGSTTVAGLSIDRYSTGNYRTDFYQADTGLAIHVGHASDTPTEKMRIHNNGNVGIGTTNPGLQLEIYTGNGANYAIRLKRYPTGAAYSDIGHISTPGTEGLAFKVSDGSSTTQEVMRVCGNGRVGIGTDAPSGLLEIQGSSSNRFRFDPLASSDTSIVDRTDLGATSFFKKMMMDMENRAWYFGVADNNGRFALAYDGGGGADPDVVFAVTTSGALYAGDVRGKAGIFSGAGSFTNSLTVTGSNDTIFLVKNTTSPAVLRTITAGGQVYFQSGTSETTNSKADFNFTSMNNGTNFMKIQGSTGRVGINKTAPTTQLHIKQGADDSTAHGIQIERSTSGAWHIYSGQYLDLVFSNNGGGYGYLQSATSVGQIDFTGQHRSFIDGMPFTKYNDFEGLIVSANKNKYYNIDKKLKTGLEAIQINESLPLVSISNVEKDKACFGVISGTEDPEARKYEQGMYVTVCDKQDGDTRAFINSVGEGAIWVVNTNGNLESGDYITTSNVMGYGQKQDDDILHNYTVAKITMDCDFNPVTQPVEILKQEMGKVNYWVQETHEDVSEEEYSNLTSKNRTTKIETYYSNENGEISAETYNTLEPHVQSTYTELTRTIYQKITKEESKTEQEGYELEVRQELVNVLDEHGQVQWGDHPTETEKAYKIRYLDADGNITDEANAVHIAAFVGCTYHCG
jgi:hypothetical protein